MSIQEQQQPNRYVKLPPQQPHDHFLADVEAEAREFPLFVSVHLDGEEARQMWEDAVLEARTCTDCGGPIEDSAPRCPSCAAIVPYYTLNCGNVFADLGLPDAEDLLAASDRAIAASRLPGFLEAVEQEGAAQALIGVALGTVCPRCAVLLPLASDQLHVCGDG